MERPTCIWAWCNKQDLVCKYLRTTRIAFFSFSLVAMLPACDSAGVRAELSSGCFPNKGLFAETADYYASAAKDVGESGHGDDANQRAPVAPRLRMWPDAKAMDYREIAEDDWDCIIEPNLDVLWHCYDVDGYEGQAWTLTRSKDSGHLFLVTDYHCSCEGLRWNDGESISKQVLLDMIHCWTKTQGPSESDIRELEKVLAEIP